MSPPAETSGRPSPTQPFEWLAAPDDRLIEFGSGGAQGLANLRVFLFAGLLGVCAAVQFVSTEPLVPAVTAVAALGFGVALFVAWRVKDRTQHPSIGYWLCTIDVSLVSAILVSFALSGQPEVALHSMLVWELYLLAIVLSAIQFNIRVVFFAGLMATAQWLAMLAWVNATHVVEPTVIIREEEVASLQILRALMIVVFTGTTALIVGRTMRLLRLSGSDALTGLANRALLDQRLAEEMAAARRWARPLSVAFLDIDHFKRFNDHWGHVAGDEALRTTARVLIEECRESDVIARWGGEEFVVVLPDAAIKDAHFVIERIRGRLSMTPISGVGPETRVTVSAGLSEFPSDGDSVLVLEQKADRRLLAAKRRGRNCVVVQG